MLIKSDNIQIKGALGTYILWAGNPKGWISSPYRLFKLQTFNGHQIVWMDRHYIELKWPEWSLFNSDRAMLANPPLNVPILSNLVPSVVAASVCV